MHLNLLDWKMRVVKSKDLKAFPIFNEISGKIVFNSDKVMFLLVEIPPRRIVPEHSHIHEQMGLCLKGKAEFISGKDKMLVDEGMFYWIKSGEKHGVISLTEESSLFLDVFNPPREDYLDQFNKLDTK
jgi:quercetin dioxygenase-like cupin family protein